MDTSPTPRQESQQRIEQMETLVLEMQEQLGTLENRIEQLEDERKE